MVKLSRDDCIYLAGLVDGEGCVQIREDKGYSSGFRPDLAVTSIDPEALEYFHSRLGGSLSCCQRKRPNSKKLYIWSLCGRKAILLAGEIAKFSKYHRKQDVLYEMSEMDLPGDGNKKKLNEEAAKVIRHCSRKRSHKQSLIARIYGVSESTVSSIKNNHLWRLDDVSNEKANCPQRAT